MAHVSLITLAVDDVERAGRFYEQLGWRRSSASVGGEIAFLAGGNTALALYGREALAAEAGVAVRSGDDPGVALAMNLGSRSEVDGFLAAAKAAGARITRPARAMDWGGYSGYFADPDGHLWEVAHNPGFPLQEDGQVELPEP